MENTESLAQAVEDVKVEVIKNVFNVSYEYLDRKFGESALPVENYYDEAVHPGSGKDVFDDRVQYQNGELGYNELPRSRKWSHIAKLNGYFPSVSTGLFTGSIYSGTENKDQDLRFNLKSIFSRLSNSIIPGLALNVHFRWLDLANKNAEVKTNQPTAAAGGGQIHAYMLWVV